MCCSLFYFFFKFLGVVDLNDKAKSLIAKMVFFILTLQFVFVISSTFQILYILDMADYQVIGFFIAVSMVIQAVIDYPSGVLGDAIGQRYVMAIAYFFYSMGFLILYMATSPVHLLLFYVVNAIGASQESGTWSTWFDNNYRLLTAEDDPKLQTYRYLQSRFGIIFQSSASIIFILGGLVATLFGRRIVFAYQAIGLFLFIFFILLYIKDDPGIKREPRSMKNFLKLTKEGLVFVLFQKYTFFYFVGFVLYNSVWALWGNLLLFPLYFAYTGTDFGVSVFRFFAWLIMIVITFFIGDVSKKLSPRKLIGHLRFIHSIIFFCGFALLIAYFPLSNVEFNLVPIVLTLIIFFIGDVPFIIADLLHGSLMVEIIPSRNRNSIYSLLPTMSLIMNAIVLTVGGSLLEMVGIPMTLMFLLVVGCLGSVAMYIGLRIVPMELETDITQKKPLESKN